MGYLDWLSHVVGVLAAIVGVVVQRAWSRRRWRALVNEAVLAVDLVNSTHLAAQQGNGVAMRARNRGGAHWQRIWNSSKESEQ